MQSKEEYKQEHGYYPDENPNTNRTVDFLRNRPQVEEMSEEVRQEQLKELGMSKKEYQQMQQDGWNFKGTGHWEFTGDRLVEIPSAIKIHIKRLSAPNTTDLGVNGCDALININAPNTTKLYVPNDVHSLNITNTLHDQIIRQLTNPQNLIQFSKIRNSSIFDITQDIKNADRELNGSADAQIKRANIARNGIRYGDISENPSINKENATKFNNTDGVSLIG